MRACATHFAMILAVLVLACGGLAAQNVRVDSLSRVAHGTAALRMQRTEALIALSREWTYIRPERAAAYGTLSPSHANCPAQDCR